MKRNILAKVELTAYTGVAAFNIGFGARTACSAFQVFPQAAWKSERAGDTLRKLEDVWENVVLLISDDISFIGRCLFARMHFRTQQAKRSCFSDYGLDPNDFTSGNLSIILVGDFGQLERIKIGACATQKLHLQLALRISATYGDTPAMEKLSSKFSRRQSCS